MTLIIIHHRFFIKDDEAKKSCTFADIFFENFK
ncbi:hypothetical protein BPO_0066 [Bergeyella porcorum]|uniref:Uncharacterized protein n=1 Tax=Bergeyella porcorum TaxID=1735111 RepID=A0AAU0EZX6_9FLAO